MDFINLNSSKVTFKLKLKVAFPKYGDSISFIV